MLPLGRITTVQLPATNQHQDLFASAAQVPLKFAPFSSHLYAVWLTGVGRVLSAICFDCGWKYLLRIFSYTFYLIPVLIPADTSKVLSAVILKVFYQSPKLYIHYDHSNHSSLTTLNTPNDV